MQSQIDLTQFTIEQVIHQIFTFRRISRMDQHLLMSVLLSKDSISDLEKTLIDKMFVAVKLGRLRIVD
ncbi:hypothetical protein NDI37_20740 [Funiculus sociatus GB2-A5]|jgi:hypothetical protein|uniref:MarR family transcriptional regulator n=1 Tax=Funiculus sociatus GB2-A5 TaxID=2933946 RepID=A0ABV0JTU2_9CYAN|nr:MULTISPECIES: hypothetical protein [unclassified Trichocoleus]MBD1908970.1 hypothetical protein [Trichocoleus sp. FACHB-832]MBD1931482.1 hypothetical protein [Trichocoleus sp. FACHB-69]MBD2004916.1 hypothetical protein [Trichocoleus sp. FACHB-40]MBD2063004.1 hypothetical protein [Trichocoleus sp. FACHB-6]